MESMKSSSGELLEAYDKYSNSIEKHINSFKAAFQNLSQTMINSSLVKGIVDTGTTLLNILSKIFSVLNNIGGLAPILTAGFSMILVRTLPKIVESFSALYSGFASLSVVLSAHQNPFTTIASGSLAASAGIGSLIAGLTIVVAFIAMIKQNAEALRKEAAQAGQSLKESFSSSDSTVEQQIIKIRELKDSIASGKLSSQELYEAQGELLSIQSELIDKYGEEASSLNLLSSSADTAANSIRTLNGEMQRKEAQDYLLRYADQISEAYQEMNRERSIFSTEFTVRNGYEDYYQQVKNIFAKYKGISFGTKHVDYDWNSSEDFITLSFNADATEAEDTIHSLYAELDALSKELGIDLNEIFVSNGAEAFSWQSVLSSGISTADAVLDKWQEIYDSAILAKAANNDTYSNIINQYKDAERDYKAALTGVYDNAEERSKAIADALMKMDGVRALFENTDFKNDPDVQRYINELFDAFEAASEKEQLRLQFEIDLEANKDGFSNNIQKVISLFADENGQFTKESILLAGQQVEAMGEVTGELTEQQLAYVALEAVAGQYGMTVSELIDAMVQFGVISSSATDGIDSQTMSLTNLSNELKGATERLNDYKKAMEGGEKGDVASQYANVYKQFQEDMEAGRTGSNAVAAAIDLFFSDDMLAALDYDLVKAAEILSGDMYQAIFSDGDNYGANFANYIRDTYGDAMDGIYQITDNGDGTFDISIESYERLAQLLGMDTDLFYALMDALDLFGTQAMLSGERAAELAQKLNLVGESAPTNNIDKVRAAIAGLATEFNTTDPVKIKALLDSLASAGYLDIDPDTSGIDNLGELIQEVLGEVQTAAEEEPTLTIDADISGVQSGVDAANALLDGINGKTATTYIETVEIGPAHAGGSSHNSSGGFSGRSGKFASGTEDAPGGPALVNELGPELISDNGRAYIAGGGKPTIVDLSPHAIVLDAEDTKRALSGNNSKLFKGIPIRAAALSLNTITNVADSGGGVKTKTPRPSGRTCRFCGARNPLSATYCIVCGLDMSQTKKTPAPSSATVPGKDKDGDKKNNNSGGGSGGDGGGSGSKSDEENWFEKELAEHKHRVQMDEETEREYLDWLQEAYKKAYEEELFDLKEYRKYEEEIYKGRQDDFKDHLSDTEHLIELEKNGDNNPTVIFNMYQQMMADIQAELEKCYARGLDSTNTYVQYLQNAWIKYSEELKDTQEEAADEAKDQVKDLVDYRIKMLKQYLKNEIENYKKRISYLKDFYDKQKELLQDEYDQEEYLDEQAEKRKTVSDIQAELTMLEYDNSAWAQKRKQKLLEELEDAEKDLGKFEKQHALELAQDELDKAYDAQVEELEKKIEELEEKLNNPKYLYDQALEDVRNNSVALYEEMIAYNDAYGTGIQQDVVDMWEEAYKSLKRYFDLYGEYYKGINLVNATGYVEQPGDNSVIIPHGGYASGTAHATRGLHRFGELGEEYIFQSKDGTKYRMFEYGDKVLDADSTNFLYKFATGGGKILSDMASHAKTTPALSPLDKMPGVAEIRMGDIIIQGNADERTVSEIRRAQREGINTILKEFSRLKK